MLSPSSSFPPLAWFTSHSLLFSYLLFSSFSPLVSAASRNVTIDDTDPSIVYSNNAPDVWNDQSCSGCTAKPPDLNNIDDGTWHDGTHHAGNPPLTASLTFNGTGIYVFGITINSTSARPLLKNQELQFTIDSQPVGTFSYTPNTPDYHYNVPFFGNGALSLGLHTLEMTVADSSFVLLDYFVVTVVDKDPPPPIVGPSSNPPTPSQPTPPGTSNSFVAPTQSNSNNNNNGYPTFAPFPSVSESAFPASSSNGVPTPSTSSSASNLDTAVTKTSHAAPIAGAVIGFALIVAGILFFVWYFRRKGKAKQELSEPSPFVGQTETMRTASVYTRHGQITSMSTNAAPIGGVSGGASVQSPSSSGHSGTRSRSGRSGTTSEPYSGLWHDSSPQGNSFGGYGRTNNAAQTNVVDPFIVTEPFAEAAVDRKGRPRGAPQLPDGASRPSPAQQRPSDRDRKRGITVMQTPATEVPPAYTYS